MVKERQDRDKLTIDIVTLPERQRDWISVMQASKKYGLDRSWIYRRVRKGVIPNRIEGERLVVPVDWFELRADFRKLIKIEGSYTKRDYISQRIAPKEYGDGTTTRLQRIESTTDGQDQ